MKKTIFTLFLALIILNIPCISFAESFYGCWKAQPERKKDNVICLQEDFVQIGEKQYNDISYSIKNGKNILKIHSTFATIFIESIDSNTIFIKGSLMPKIKYIRISCDDVQNR